MIEHVATVVTYEKGGFGLVIKADIIAQTFGLKADNFDDALKEAKKIIKVRNPEWNIGEHKVNGTPFARTTFNKKSSLI